VEQATTLTLDILGVVLALLENIRVAHAPTIAIAARLGIIHHLRVMHLVLLVIAGIILHQLVTAPVLHVLVASIKMEQRRVGVKLFRAVITPNLLVIVHIVRVLLVNTSLVQAVQAVQIVLRVTLLQTRACVVATHAL
jgi:hypothetical protein